MRPKFETRQILLVGSMQKETALQVIKNAPIDGIKPLEVLIREQVKIRKPDQNALMWSGPLNDIANQAWLDGKRFSANVWHHFFKSEFLPEEYDHELTKEGYVKWEIAPDGSRVLVGSTTELTRYGFSQYLEQIHAYGANLGVMFMERAA